MIRKICFFGGAGSGKSLTAARVFVELKLKHFNVELVAEYVKLWVYQKRTPNYFDQYYIFGKQLNAEHTFLSNGVDVIITDSPLFMQIPYAISSGVSHEPLIAMAKEFELKFPSLNIFLERDKIPYSEKGRYEKYDDALVMDKKIKDFLDEMKLPYASFKTDCFEDILNYILERN